MVISQRRQLDLPGQLDGIDGGQRDQRPRYGDQSRTFTGTVLSVSPDGGTRRGDRSRPADGFAGRGAATWSATYGGVGTRAQWSPDSQTVYITPPQPHNQLLVHSAYYRLVLDDRPPSPYVDVAVTVPSVGAFFATNTNSSRRPAATALSRARAPCTTPGAPHRPTTPSTRCPAIRHRQDGPHRGYQ